MKRKIILLSLIALTLCSCGGKSSKKAVVTTPENEPVATKSVIQKNVETGVLKTSAYNDGFYSVSDRYIIEDDKNLETFAGYMKDNGLGSALKELTEKYPLTDYTLFIVPIESGSGGYRYTITTATVENDTFKLVSHSEGDEVMTCDMAMYYPYALVPKAQLKNVPCTDWVRPVDKNVVVYKATTVKGEYDLESLPELRKLAEKHHAENGAISIDKNQRVLLTLTFKEVKNANDFITEPVNKGSKVSSFTNVVAPSVYKEYTGTKATLVTTNATADIYAQVANGTDYIALENYYQKLAGEIIDQYIPESPEHPMLYSLRTRINLTGDAEALNLYNTLSTPPCATEELNVSVYYHMG